MQNIFENESPFGSRSSPDFTTSTIFHVKHTSHEFYTTSRAQRDEHFKPNFGNKSWNTQLISFWRKQVKMRRKNKRRKKTGHKENRGERRETSRVISSTVLLFYSPEEAHDPCPRCVFASGVGGDGMARPRVPQPPAEGPRALRCVADFV